ncbi:FMN-dependent NADH-azoreductase [Microbispora triticiradicis]|uniref:FMN dependent NADH:quinone oxidoreductase n=3 Tax=Microbispora TaxID=2005 RepID=A0ABY3LT14_9ACTN|nr:MULTISPECIES: NAD(P)H-dependent oxidoreductase [Microbispora]RGA00790.1 FMN-dependent NADH-azoreductase [Microbispora triticiradicis]TLP54567.1 FMN-dependent NADH-azoreductase [Microbispora fusca]TYB51534.1 FMN-dependent NADH-azoreductase [Microbispora tritici]GLW20767.1 FMN-dependent NADH-azoreductase [Microbispora amethystogenes]
MSHLLHIDASARAKGSVSREIAATFRDGWTGTVSHRDLGAEPLPHLTGSAITSRWSPADQHTAEERAAAALQDALVDELLAADAYLFAVPMYNYGVPSTFKAWLDHVLIVGRTVGVAETPVAGRPATLVLSKGGGYRPGTPREGWDYAEPYLRRILGEVLGLDLHVIAAELTLADTTPAMADLRGLAAESLAAAHAAAGARVRSLAAA